MQLKAVIKLGKLGNQSFRHLALLFLENAFPHILLALCYTGPYWSYFWPLGVKKTGIKKAGVKKVVF